ncbi:alanine aminotransferase 2-like [Anguilla rostrata]|uniref:alanine aminotransferase 2-like n=1 Tax=Anguilla rostrata TaxID=7938 RepID=UPI0030CC8ABA
MGDGGGGGGSPEGAFRDGEAEDGARSRTEVDPRVREIRASQRDVALGRAAQIRRGGAQGSEKELIDICWGDAHSTGIKPLSFVRQVLAACLHPELLHSDRLPVDARQRAQRLLGECEGGSLGSYTHSCGLPHVRRSVAEFITRRDGGVASLPENIFISLGSQRALTLVLSLLAQGEGVSRTGVLTPAPACYTVAMALAAVGVAPVPYHLCEEQGWVLRVDEVCRVLRASRGHCDPRVLYVVNPGNPTGHVQSKESIEQVIRLAAEERLILVVNEVDQDSVHGEGSEFVSYRKVLFEMGPQFSDAVELISLHSISRGLMGEGGLRSGYMEVLNVDPAVISTFQRTLLSVDICPPVPGQIALDLMACPPRPGDPSHATYAEEVQTQRDALIGNVRRAREVLDSLPGVSCQTGAGGHYLFPRLHLPTAAVEQARSAGVEADLLYSGQLLEEEGLCVGPGCEFGQREGTYHIRLHVMACPEVLEDALGRLKRFHLRFMRAFS